MIYSLVALLLVGGAAAQEMRDSSRWWIGGGAGYGWTSTRGEIVAPGFDPSCGTITGGTGNEWSLAALLERRQFPWLHMQLRAGVAHTSATLDGTAAPPQPVSRPDGSIVEAVVTQRIEAERTDLHLSLLALVPVFAGLNLIAGVEVRAPLSHSERHIQVALAPDDLLLVNNARTMALSEGELIPLQPFSLGIVLGASYDLPVSSRALLSPELRLGIPLTNEVRAGTLRTFRAALGATLRFALDSPDSALPPPDTATTPPPPRPLAVTVRTTPETVGVEINEYDSVEALPLLNRIFFDLGGDTLPTRYNVLTREQTRRFTGESLSGSALDVYHDLLNILGRRMRENPRATLELEGYHAGSERAAALARRRAETVRRYLVERWGVAERRIPVRSGGLPPQAAREATREGSEENARVEMESRDPLLLSPWVRVFTQRVATPPELIFHPTIESGDLPVARWQLDVVRGDGETWRSFNGNGTPPASIVWDWRSTTGDLPRLPISLRYLFRATDTAGVEAVTEERILPITYNVSRDTLRYSSGDSTIESYSLLLFDYDSAAVSRGDRPLLEAIAGAIRPGARVTVTGYTDSIGESDYNRRLALARAREVARGLQRLLPSTVDIVVSDEGGERERFPYSTPEGRAHCRTVFLLVRTPIAGAP